MGATVSLWLLWPSWLSGAAFGLAACGATPAVLSPRTPEVAPLPLRPPAAIGHDFQWRQRVVARWPSGTHSFDAVLQKREGELILVGLSPLGLPGFVFRLSPAARLEVDNRTGKTLPFKPGYVLADVQRVFFPWLQAPPEGFTGERSGRRGESIVFERYERGRLVERRFERDTGQGRERVLIRYTGSAPSGAQAAPARAELTNHLLRYGLVIETLEQSAL